MSASPLTHCCKLIARSRQFTAIAVCLALLSSGCQKSSPSAVASSAPVPSQSPLPALLPLIATNFAPLSGNLKPAIRSFVVSAANNPLPKTQGVWIQRDQALLGDYQGNVPLSAASLTKAATSLAALQTLGAAYRYQTRVGVTGVAQKGVLKGDLIIQGGQDPFFVWEDAIALGNLLTQKGIQQIDGNLVIQGPFYMNFETQAAAAGAALQQGLDSAEWTSEALQQYQTLPATTLKPQIAIKGDIISAKVPPSNTQWIAQHQSLPLASLLKKMNRYSNNPMADMIANSIGGADVVAKKAIATTGVSPTEVQLINGSGLSAANRISPRAVCGIFRAIERLVQPQGMTIADIFTVVGQDESVLEGRSLPKQSVLKSGTLDTVSALAGALPTQQGVVWFALMNNDGDVETFRKRQEAFLESLTQTLGTTATLPTLKSTITEPSADISTKLWVQL